MIKEGSFGPYEAVCMITIVMVSKVLFTSPGQLISIVGSTGWYMTFISALIAAVGFTFIYLLLKQTKGKNIVEAFELAFGRPVGFISSGLLAALFLVNAAIAIREFTDVIKVYALPKTQPLNIILLFVVVVIIFCISGLESVARFSKLVAYFLLAGLVVVLLLSIQNFEFFRLFPIQGYGIKNTIIHGAERSSVYGEVIIVGVISGSLQGINHVKKAGYASILISSILISSVLLTFSLAFPYYTASEVVSPMYELSAIINYGRFFQRLDPIFFFVWNISSIIFVSVYFYMTVSIYSKMFRIPDKKPVILPLSIILFTLVFIPQDIHEVVYGYVKTSREYGGIIFFVLPLIAYAASKLFRRRRMSNE